MDIKIIHNESETPDGFEKINKNILKGSKQIAYLCFRRSKDFDAISDIRILYNGIAPGLYLYRLIFIVISQSDAEFEKLEPSIVPLPSENQIHLSVKRISKGNFINLLSHSYQQ